MNRAAQPPLRRLLTRFRSIDWPTAIVANALILSVLVYAKLLRHWDLDLYYRSVQEDEALEWATFWAFVAAGVLALLGASRQRRAGIAWPWFSIGLGLFCLWVAMEEISWGQRLLGYRPPDYFLAENFQQELNFHNVIATRLRKLGLKVVILGYGIVLPLAMAIPQLGIRLRKASVIAPPWLLMPSFAAAFLTYQIYPWKFSGELVELMLGIGFLFAILLSETPGRFGLDADRLEGTRIPRLLAGWVAVCGLGLATSSTLQALSREHPARIASTRAEIDALVLDFQALPDLRCSTHKRVYTFRHRYEASGLDSGTFSNLVSRGLPEDRAAFFLDPWNTPYWIRHRCDDDGRTTLLIVYSFGPNRKRDSSRTEVLGDDIGVVTRPSGAGADSFRAGLSDQPSEECASAPPSSSAPD